jgi:hypothetical protein
VFEQLDDAGALDRSDPLVQGVLRVIVLDCHGELRDDRPGVDARVDEVDGRPRDLHTVGEGITDPVCSGKRREQRWMGVDDAQGEAVHEFRSENPHEARRDDPVRVVLSNLFGEGAIPRLPIGEVLGRDDEGLHPGGTRPVEDSGIGTIGSDCRDLDAATDIGEDEGVEHGLGETTGAGGQENTAHPVILCQTGPVTPVDQKPRMDPGTSSEGSDPTSKRNREGTILALFFAGALLASTYPLPYRAFAAVFALLGLIWAVRFFIAGSRARRALSAADASAAGTVGAPAAGAPGAPTATDGITGAPGAKSPARGGADSALRSRPGGNWIFLGSLAGVGCLYILLTTLGTMAIWPVQAAYEDCVRAAVTQQAAIDCTTEYNEGLRTWFEDMTGQPYPG